MSERGERLRQMEHEVKRFHRTADDRDQNHRRYLAEALQSLRQMEDPLDVLRFLDRLLASPFSTRPLQRQALTDVGEWLGVRLLRDPSLDRETLAWEFGWMHRLVLIHVPAPSESRGGGYAPQGQRWGAQAAQEFPGFAKKVEAVEARRRELAAAAKRVKVEAPAAPVRVAPKQLPAVFEAEFADVGAARDARKKAREREKAGKSKKVTWLALKPTDALLGGLAKGLTCTLETDGCESVFEDMAKRDGRPRTFWVADVRGDEGRLVVGRITLDRPPEEAA